MPSDITFSPTILSLVYALIATHTSIVPSNLLLIVKLLAYYSIPRADQQPPISSSLYLKGFILVCLY
ncbi:hypothetical protein BDQ94DRAFT_135779 [Aspergillus welwitschiae]|uniref:Uncharacterized protein n=1 Tax=Aspergillus welwitschiae TaxID=1341132 RepID=A0A3F3QG73_9EURO|nr:hypothetical protein BDQ94DRAFT_135779 [Aspergillus welwitschiae]RDH38171.1 hypothetical protein BDQ94DRAFT_135779 [Aspergillus welwitschiae]